MDRVERLKAFLQESPTDNFLQHALALEYVKQGDESSARQLFEQILARDSAYIGSYYHLAKLLERVGEAQQALDWYQKGMQAAQAAGDQHALDELRSAYQELADAD